MPTKLYLVRHGETIDNQRQIMQGQTQGRLNANGIAQAEQLRRKMQGIHIDAYFSSDLHRAIETCSIIMGRQSNQTIRNEETEETEKHHDELPFITTKLLRERNWGSFTGRYIPELKNEQWPDDIETLDALKKRAQQFIDLIRESYPDKTVLAVGHGIINKAIQSVYYNLPMNQVQKMMNAEVRELIL